MARNPSSKNLLTFNGGELSPFLDNRVDVEKAANAAKRMENFICEVEGPARRRPGTRFVTEIGPAVIASGETAYVEFPLWYRMLYQSLLGGANPDGTQAGPLFKGTVRYWENGTVQLIGKAKYDKSANYPVSASTYPFSMWIGATEISGISSLVANLPTGTTGSTGGDWVDIDWTGVPPAGQYVWLPYGNWPYIEGAGGSSYPNRAIRIWEYPGGLVVPHVVYGPLTGTFANYAMRLGVSRSGNDLVLEGEMSVYEGGFGQPGVGTWLWTIDVSDSNPVNWVETTFEIVDDLLGGWGLGDQYQEFTENRLIPDSDTLGYMYIALSNFAADIQSSVQIGPIFREGRGPIVLGSGTAPT